MAFRWNETKNQFGVPGMIDADWQRGAGKGTHATLSRFDMHNTLIAAGPDFHRGEIVDLPSGNVDLAPTILRILGIIPPQQLDGRILSEAMVNIGPAAPELKPENKTIEADKRFSVRNLAAIASNLTRWFDGLSRRRQRRLRSEKLMFRACPALPRSLRPGD